MKYLNILIWALIFFAIPQVNAAIVGINQIDIQDENTVNAIFSENPDIEAGEVQAEIKILHDMSLRGAVVKAGSSDKVEIFLDTDILANTKYSILTISGAEGSIDFETPEDVIWFTGFSLEEGDSQRIESVEIEDARTLLITYAQDVVASSFDYKLLAEKKIQKIEKLNQDVPSLTMTLEPPLESSEDYILMFIDLKDSEGEIIEFDTGIYDFTAPTFWWATKESSENNILDETMNDDTPEEVSPSASENITPPVVDENNDEAPIVLEDNSIVQSWEQENSQNMPVQNMGSSELPNLNAAPGENIVAGDSETWNVNKVASTVTANPQAWATAWVLLLASIFINTFFYYTRRKR